MLRYFIILLFMLIGFSKTYTFYFSKNMEKLKQEVMQYVSDNKLLEIDWAYLNQNARLKNLADVNLQDWDTIKHSQMKDLEKSE